MKLNFNKLQLYKDNYNIYNLITKINPYYRLYFDLDKKFFIIINIANSNEICMKFNSFNTNILKILQLTKVENSKNLFDFIDFHNEEINNKNLKNQKDKTQNMLNELNKICKRKSQITSCTINKIFEGKNA